MLADGREAEEQDVDARKHGRMLLPMPTGGANRAATALVLGLPAELLPQILGPLDTRDICILRCTCRAVRLATSCADLWLELAQRRWKALQLPVSLLPNRGCILHSPVATGAHAMAWRSQTGKVLETPWPTASIADVCARIVPWPCSLVRVDEVMDVGISILDQRDDRAPDNPVSCPGSSAPP